MSKYSIDLKNVQCIKEALDIKVFDKAINIKYGFNGLGKSSIGKGLDAYINSQGNKKALDVLTPFDNSGKPSIEIDCTDAEKPISKCLIFNKDYIDNHLFTKPDTVIESAKDIFLLSNSNVQKFRNEIESLLAVLKDAIHHASIEKWKEKVTYLEEKGPVNEKGEFAGGRGSSQGLKQDCAIENYFDSRLYAIFGDFIDAKYYNEWLKVRESVQKTSVYTTFNICPICGSHYEYMNKDDIEVLINEGNKEFKANQVGIAYDTMTKLSDLSKAEDKNKILDILHSRDPITDNEVQEIKDVYSYLQKEKNKLDTLEYFQNEVNPDEKDAKNLAKIFEFTLLDTSVFTNDLNSDLGKAVVHINSIIKNLATSLPTYIDLLKDFNSSVNNAITKSMNEVNQFLSLAGIPYKFAIEKNKDDLLTKIVPVGTTTACDDVKQHLSYGEQNSLSLALFGAIANRSSDVDLVILDDPISSFDQNKKYAVMHFLFNKKSGMLKDKTVLMLTHDMESIIDLFYLDLFNLPDGKVIPFILGKDNNGIITEEELERKDVLSSSNLELSYARSENLDMFCRVVHLRRYFDLNGLCSPANDDAYYAACLLNGIIHLQEKPTAFNKSLSPEEYKKGAAFIRDLNYIKTFDYHEIIKKYSDAKELIYIYKNSGDSFEKLAVLRAIFGSKKWKFKRIDDITYNYLNSVYHIENDLIYTIKSKTDTMPPYIIELCDAVIEEIEGNLNGQKN